MAGKPAETPLSGLRVLVVENEPHWTRFLCDPLRTAGADVSCATCRDRAIETIRHEKPALVILDLALEHDDPQEDGIKILQTFAVKKRPFQIDRQMDPAFIVATQLDDAQLAVDAMELGVAGFLFKLRIRGSGELIIAMVKRVWRDLRRWRAMIAEVRRDICSESEIMERVLAEADRAALTNSTVVISGETGAGKELIARRIHASSVRVGEPFVAVNCGEVSENLIQSALFGHVKGAFTGAIEDKSGLFEQADGGTLFLDEIGSMPLEMQIKLLRVLEEKVVRRVGGKEPISVNVRVVAADQFPLSELVETGRLREDLYFRLEVIDIHVPPLRERPEDIIPLARHFNELVSAGMGMVAKTITPDATRKLSAHHWPGNVRELRNVIERAVVMSESDRIDADSLKIQNLVRDLRDPDRRASQRPHPDSPFLSRNEAAEQLDTLVLKAPARADLRLAVSLIQTVCRTSTGTVRLPRNRHGRNIICSVVTKLSQDHALSNEEFATMIGNNPRSIEAWIREGGQNGR